MAAPAVAALVKQRAAQAAVKGARDHAPVLGGAVVVALVGLLLLLSTPVLLLSDLCNPGGGSEGTPDSLTLSQRQVAERIVDAGDDIRAPEKHEIAALATGIVESTLQNLPAEKSDHYLNPNRPSPGRVTSVGVFQQQEFSPWTDKGRNRMNVHDAATTFYEEAKRLDRPGYTVGQLAQDVQNSAFPGKYSVKEAEARQLHAQITGGNRALATMTSQFAAATITRAAPLAAVAARRPEANASSQIKLAWPTAAQTITSPFGGRSSPCAGCSSFHEGLDIGAPANAPIGAAAAGVVVQRGWVGGYGNYVCVRHAANFSTCYAHMSRYGRFNMGNPVAKGDVVGYVGSTGVGTGAHLHFEVRHSPGMADPAVDPAPYLSGAAAGPSSAAGFAGADCGGAEDADGLAAGDAPLTSGPLAQLRDGVVHAPREAPAEVRRMIAAGNAMQNLPYTYGGGHNGQFRPSPGFDCSSTVSYVLFKAGLLDRPLVSGDFERWGKPGRGKYVSIYSNNGHMWIEIAGQRLDTSPTGGSVNTERGPRWRGAPRSTRGFTVTHPPGL